MDRQIIYPGQVPIETDLLLTNKNTMTAIAKLCAAVLGVASCVSGFATTQTVVPSLGVLVAAGDIYSLQNIDGTAYSSLAADTTHSIVKQGISLDPVTLPITPPATAGFSINYLIQVGYQDSDTGSTVLPYYNASNPSIAYSGPANSGAAQPTKRAGIVSIQAKAGTAATTGTQTTPAPDAGYTGLYVVTVANGTSTVVNGNISALATAPFINSTLHGLTPAFAVALGVGPATASTHAAQVGQLHSAYATRGLVAGNNATTPLTKYDAAADLVVLRNPTTGALATRTNVAAITNDITVAGSPSTANGRDQAAAFTASTWVHLYFIWNGTTLATLSSAAPPTTGPTLPAGYTHWAYIGAVVLNASTQLALVKMRGAWATYDTAIAVVSGGTATSNTAFSTATSIPPNALEWKAIIQNLAVSATAGGAYSLTLFLDSYQAGMQGIGGASAVVGVSGGSCLLPNVGQSATYRITVGTGTGPTTTIQAQGYKMPNGGE